MQDWRSRLRDVGGDHADVWHAAIALANARLDFVRTNALDQTVQRQIGDALPPGLATKPIRLAVLGSSTLAHLFGAIRVAAMRRGLHVSVYENDYGQYWQEIADPAIRHCTPSGPTPCCWRWTRIIWRRALPPAWTQAEAEAALADDAGAHSRLLAHAARGVRLPHHPAGRRCRCICRCLATTNTGCPARAATLPGAPVRGIAAGGGRGRRRSAGARQPRRARTACARGTTRPVAPRQAGNLAGRGADVRRTGRRA